MEKYILAILILTVSAILYLKIANYLNMVAIPTANSSHKIPTIIGGGVLFLIALWFFFLSTGFSYPYLVLGTSLIGLVSFADDLKPMSISTRLPFQFLAILLVLLELGLLGLPWWALLILLIGGIGFINAYNFMDGINGIIGLYSLAVIASFYLINITEGLVNPDLLVYLSVALLVFGFYNFRQSARFFAGDVGSISIAVILFYLGTLFTYQLQSPVILLLVIVNATDIILTTCYRKLIGESILTHHRHYIYYKLVDIGGLSHLSVAIIYACLQLAMGYLAYKTYLLSLLMQCMILGSAIIMFISLYLVMFFMIKKKMNLSSS